MKKIISGLLLMLLFVNLGNAQQVPKDPNLHFYRLKFNLTPGNSNSFLLPRKDCPVRIEVSIGSTLVNGRYTNAPLLLQGLIIQESNTGQIKIKDSGSLGECRDFGVFPPSNALVDCDEGRVTIPIPPDAESSFVAIRAYLLINLNTGILTIQTTSRPSDEGIPLTYSDVSVCVNLWF